MLGLFFPLKGRAYSPLFGLAEKCPILGNAEKKCRGIPLMRSVTYNISVYFVIKIKLETYNVTFLTSMKIQDTAYFWPVWKYEVTKLFPSLLNNVAVHKYC